MKRIGILTFHRSINYGAYMQCFSLANRMRREFPDCEVEVIDYESRLMHDHYIPRFSLACIKHPTLYPRIKKKYRAFQKVLPHLPLSENTYCFDGSDDAFAAFVSDRYDAVVVGSDAVWNWLKRGFPNPYLLSFGSGFKKFSYAASAYGMSPEQIKEAEMDEFGKALSEYAFIGVRDEYTASLVKEATPDAPIAFTCDPTVFLEVDDVLSALGQTAEEYKAAMRKRYHIPANKKIIGVMETDKRIIPAIRQKCGDDCSIISLYNYLPGADRQALDLDPLEWSLFFGLFDITFTNYFHGTLLSLRNRTPVICFDRTPFSRKNEGKIHDVLRRMDLLACYFGGEADLSAACDHALSVLAQADDYRRKIHENREKLAESTTSFMNAIRGAL